MTWKLGLPDRRLAVGLVELHLTGFQGCVARAGFGHEAEGDRVQVGDLGTRETVTLLVGGIGLVVVETCQLDMAVGLVFDKLVRARANR